MTIIYSNLSASEFGRIMNDVRKESQRRQRLVDENRARQKRERECDRLCKFVETRAMNDLRELDMDDALSRTFELGVDAALVAIRAGMLGEE